MERKPNVHPFLRGLLKLEVWDRWVALVETIVRVGHLFDMSVTAEGVETLCDLAIARNAGCDAVQGYYIAHPMSADDALRYAASHLAHADRFEARRA